MTNFSFWEKETFLKGFDFVVIGSGIVGLSTAISLKQHNANLKVLVVERGILPLGASTKNAGFACFGSVSELVDDLENGISEEKMWELVAMRWKGLQKLRGLLGDKNMAYENWGGFEIFTAEDQNSYEQCLEKMPYFNQRLAEITEIKECYALLSKKEIEKIAFAKVKHIIRNQGEGQLHTGKMMNSLLKLAREKGVEILTGINIQKIVEENSSVSLLCEGNFEIKAPKVMVCTNGFARQLLPELEVKPARNQVWVTEKIPNLALQGAFHYQQGYYYFRNIENRILIGGGRHLDKENEFTAEFGESEIIQTGLEKILYELILPNQKPKIEYKWSGIMGLGSVKKPIIQAISPNMFVAVRMGGMGVAIGSLVGEEAAKLAILS